MKKCEGYIYLDMLAALSMCLFIIFALFPLFDQLKLNKKSMLLRTEAHYLLYEKLTAFADGEIEAISTEIQHENHLFTLTWGVPKGFPEMVEGCIHYENAFGKTEEVCDATKK